MALPFNKNLKNYARDLKSKMPDAERLLWGKIRRKQLLGFQFYRQKNIGNYIVDFYCPSAKMIIEVDGGQHYSAEGTQSDDVRDRYLGELGFGVLRFPDNEIFSNIEGVLEKIHEGLKNPPESPF